MNGDSCPVAATAAVLHSYRSIIAVIGLRVAQHAMYGRDKSAFIVELAVEDWEALGKLRESVKWTLRPRTKPAKEN
jgi:hypothetical protein